MLENTSSSKPNNRRPGKPSGEFACILLVIAAVSGWFLVGAQVKPCGTEAAPLSKNWKTVPCDAAPEPSDNALGALRRARGELFDDSTGRKKPDDLLEGTGRTGRGRVYEPGVFRPLPVSESDAVIVGKIVSFQPYFSNDRTAIYHEFTIKVEEVLRDTSFRAVVGSTLPILGEGGSLRMPDGRVFTDFIPPKDENDIRVGGRYVLFLVYRPKGDAFGLFKVWELREDHAFPMALSDVQKAQRGELPLAGLPESAFLEEVRNAVSRAR